MMLTYGSLNKHLRERFPILDSPKYTDMIGGIEAGPYVIFGVLFNHYLVEVAGEADTQQTARIAEFLEEMIACGDLEVANLLKMEILPTLLKSQAIVEAYWPWLGDGMRHELILLAPRAAPGLRVPPES